MAIMRAKYKDYPGVVRDMENRHIVYNKSLDFVKREEKAGRAFVFRPENLIKIERIEKDPKSYEFYIFRAIMMRLQDIKR